MFWVCHPTTPNRVGAHLRVRPDYTYAPRLHVCAPIACASRPMVCPDSVCVSPMHPHRVCSPVVCAFLMACVHDGRRADTQVCPYGTTTRYSTCRGAPACAPRLHVCAPIACAPRLHVCAPIACAFQLHDAPQLHVCPDDGGADRQVCGQTRRSRGRHAGLWADTQVYGQTRRSMGRHVGLWADT